MPKESAQIRHHAVITPKLHADSKVNKKKERIEKDESYTIIMTGATGDFEKKINGTYRQCKKKKWKGKVKLYEKVGDSSICLEYYPPMKEWHVTRNVEPPLMDACCFAFLLSKKGAHIDTCWAYCPIPDDLKTNDFCLPEECVEKWRVWNGDPEHGRWETQNDVLILSPEAVEERRNLRWQNKLNRGFDDDEDENITAEKRKQIIKKSKSKRGGL